MFLLTAISSDDTYIVAVLTSVCSFALTEEPVIEEPVEEEPVEEQVVEPELVEPVTEPELIAPEFIQIYDETVRVFTETHLIGLTEKDARLIF